MKSKNSKAVLLVVVVCSILVVVMIIGKRKQQGEYSKPPTLTLNGQEEKLSSIGTYQWDGVVADSSKPSEWGDLLTYIKADQNNMIKLKFSSKINKIEATRSKVIKVENQKFTLEKEEVQPILIKEVSCMDFM